MRFSRHAHDNGIDARDFEGAKQLLALRSRRAPIIVSRDDHVGGPVVSNLLREVFEHDVLQPRERDRVYAFSQTHLDPAATDAPPIRIFVDPKSFIYLHGMVLDYEETLMRQGFNFINPHSTKSCGCGSSFST